MFNRRVFPTFHVFLEPNLEANGFAIENSGNRQNHQSISSYLSFGEKAVVALSTIFYAIGNTCKFFNQKNNFLSNSIFMQLLNSVLPFLATNLGECLNMLNNLDKNQKLLLQYQHSKEASSNVVLLNHYQLALKVGLRTAFSDRPEIAKSLEPAFIDLVTQLYFSGKTLTQLNQSLNTTLRFLQNGPASRQRYWKGFTIALLALVAMLIATFGAYFIESKITFTMTGIIAACIITSIIVASHILEHTTYFAPALKKQTNAALKTVDEIEKSAEKIIEGVYSQIFLEEKNHLKNQVERLTLDERMILLNKTQGRDYVVQPFTNTGSQAIAWRFFKNMGRQAGENAWINAKQDYQSALQQLTNRFNDLCNIIQAQKMDILNTFPDYQNSLAFILASHMNLSTQVDAIHQELEALEKLINCATPVLNYKFVNVRNKIDDFKDDYKHFKNSQKVYNEMSDNMTYLKHVR